MLLTVVHGRVAGRSIHGLLSWTALGERLSFTVWLGALTLTIARFAQARPLWFDELFTLHLACAGHPGDLLHHLAEGVDLNPPLSYWCTRWCVLVWGVTGWSLRLPALAGMVLGLVCLFAVLRRRKGFLTAWLAAVGAVASAKVWIYFLEARPYGLAFGFAGLALLCWQRASETESRWWCIALAIAAALGSATHYYFVLVLLALGLAEVVRWTSQRRCAWRVMLALTVGGMVVAACRPLWLAASRDYAPGFWAKSSLRQEDWQQAITHFVDPLPALPVLIALLAAFIAGSKAQKHQGTNHDRGQLPPHETAAVVLLALTPLFGVLLGATLTGGFYYRYALPATLGFGALAAIGLERVAAGNRIALAVGLAALIGFGLPGSAKPALRFFQNEERANHALATFLHAHAAGSTVIVADPFAFARLWHEHSSGSFRPLFVADPECQRACGQPDTVERGLLKLRTIADVPVATWDELLAQLTAGTPMAYYGPEQSWLIEALAPQGWQGDRLAARNGCTLLRLRPSKQ